CSFPSPLSPPPHTLSLHDALPISVFVRHQFHQQHALMKVIRRWHAHPGGGKTMQRIHLGALPRSLLLLTAVTGALGHRTSLTARSEERRVGKECRWRRDGDEGSSR